MHSPTIRPSSPILVMGVTACGKSEIGRNLAQVFAVPFIEGDALHPQRNIRKMSQGLALNDEDRWPWLDALASEVASLSSAQGCAVFSCSALKFIYRQSLREKLPNLITVFLDLDPETSQHRASARAGHFMPASLVQSQFSVLERPENEPHTFIIDARASIQDVVDNVLHAMA